MATALPSKVTARLQKVTVMVHPLKAIPSLLSVLL
jgi:hypothetical protein